MLQIFRENEKLVGEKLKHNISKKYTPSRKCEVSKLV